MGIKITNTDSGLSVASLSLAEMREVSNISNRKLSQVMQMFVTMGDEKVRPEHAALHNTVWRADDPNAPTPPLGEGCRCRLKFYAIDTEVADKTGLEVAPSDAPEPGDEALNEFWQTAKQSDQSKDPGGKVTPTDTFGKTIGTAIEDGKIKPDEGIDAETGNKRLASEVKSIAQAEENGLSKRQVLAAIASLQSMAITPATQTRIVTLAKELLKEKPSLKDEQALFDVIMRLRPGRVASLSPARTRKNARAVAKQIRKAYGSLRG